MKWVSRICGWAMMILALANTASAQFSSGIEGTVRDASGAAVPTATVTVTDVPRGIVKTIATSSEGFYRIDSIGASTYLVEVKATGFESVLQRDLQIQAGQLRTLDFTLRVGAVTTDVTVSANQESLNLTTPATGAIIEAVTVHQVPLPGQNVYALATLTPGVTGNAVTSGDNYTNEYSININAGGLRQESNGFRIDNAFTNTPSRGGATSISPNPEIVESINIQANAFDASKGRNGGALVDVYTRAGANIPHGTLDYFYRNAALSAKTHFGPVAPFQRNEAGATFGGPAIRDKLFYFGAIDVLRSSQTTAYQATFETPEFDNWAKANLPNTLGTQILLQAPPIAFPTSGILTVAQLQAQTPGYYAPPAGIPANLPAVGTSNVSFSTPKNGYQWSVRGDYYVGPSDRIYADVIRTYNTGVGSIGRAALDVPQVNSSDFGNVNWTHTFSPRLLNQVGANIIRPQGALEATPLTAIPLVNVNSLSGFSNWGAGNFVQTTYGWNDVLTATVKSHTLKAGFDIFNIREADNQTSAFTRPSYNFNNLLDFVQDLPVFESGSPVNLNTHQQGLYQRHYRAYYQGFFLQDDWKVVPRLTVNAGLRFDEMKNFFSIYSPTATNFVYGTGTTAQQQIGNGRAIVLGQSKILDHNIWGLNPRVGFAWDVRGNGTTSLRGGFGLFSDQPPYLRITDLISTNLPNYFTPSINVYSGQPTPKFQQCSPPQGFNQVCPIVDTSNITLNQYGGVDGQRSNVNGFSPNYKLAQVETWTLSLQQLIGSKFAMELNYSASAAHHLPVENDNGINRFSGDLIQNKGTLRRLSPYFGNVAYSSSIGNSIGNYGSAVLSRRLSNRFALQGIYTYGKTLDTVSQSGSLDAGSITTVTGVIDAQNLRAQRGRADFSLRHQFTTNGTYIIPPLSGNPLKRYLLGGWEFSGLWVMQSGLPFTVYNTAPFTAVFDANGNVVGNTGGDYNADGTNYDLPNRPAFGASLHGVRNKQYLTGVFQKSDFGAPTLGTEGTLGRNTYEQPGYNNLNFTFNKTFETPFFFGERMHYEARAEITNLFNRVNLIGVNSDLNSSSSVFGRSTSQLPARYIQLHLRASF